MVEAHRLTLSSLTTDLLASGRVMFTREEAMLAMGVGHGAFLDAAERLQRRGRLVRPRRGFYVISHPSSYRGVHPRRPGTSMT